MGDEEAKLPASTRAYKEVEELEDVTEDGDKVVVKSLVMLI